MALDQFSLPGPFAEEIKGAYASLAEKANRSGKKSNVFVNLVSKFIAVPKSIGQYYWNNFGAADVAATVVGAGAYLFQDTIHPQVVQHIVPLIQPTINAGLNLVPHSLDFLNLPFITDFSNQEALYPRAEMGTFYAALFLNNIRNIKKENKEAGNNANMGNVLMSAAGRTLRNMTVGEAMILPLQEGFVHAGQEVSNLSGLSGMAALGIGWFGTKALVDVTYASANKSADLITAKVKAGITNFKGNVGSKLETSVKSAIRHIAVPLTFLE